ncbi:MAG TPA: alpha/beta fold hydrolase [Polyangiaceae bacterium]|nr:alpha/beta fold hydrolase [Polyangiaceae bacterium]
MYAWNGRVKLRYEVTGNESAAPLCLVQGLARPASHWGDFCDALSPYFRLVTFDNRGVGKSSTPLPPYTTRQMAKDALAVLDAAGIDSAHVFGVSLGGMIAQEIALLAPARVRRLVLGCTRASRRAGTPMSLSAIAAFAVAGALPPDAAMARVAPFILSSDFIKARPEVLEAWRRTALEDPPRRMGVFGQIVAALKHDSVQHLSRIRHPTLIVTGDADRLISPECSRFLQRAVAGSELEVIPGAGHEFPIEAPQATTSALRRFLLDEPQAKADAVPTTAA